MFKSQYTKKSTMVYTILSVLLVLMPILFDISYSKIAEYARRTYIIEGKYVYFYAIATILGLLMSFHFFFY